MSNNGSIAGNITNNAHLTVANPNAQSYIGAISGSGGLTKTAAGALILAGSNLYSGGTEVDGGTLEVDGSLAAGGNVQVQSGATLSGSGSVGNVTVGPGAAVAPGSIGGGTLTAASLILSNSNSLTYALGTGNSSDSLLAVVGGLTAGSDLTVNVMPGTNWIAGPYALATFDSLVDNSNDFSGWTVTGVGLGRKLCLRVQFGQPQPLPGRAFRARAFHADPAERRCHRSSRLRLAAAKTGSVDIWATWLIERGTSEKEAPSMCVQIQTLSSQIRGQPKCDPSGSLSLAHHSRHARRVSVDGLHAAQIENDPLNTFDE